MMAVGGRSSAEPKVALLLPRAGATGSCKILGRCLSTVRMQPQMHPQEDGRMIV